MRVNAIAPGLVKTDMARALWEADEAAIARRTPLARLGVPEDIANAALFLASDLAAWITGHILVVDGGAMVAGRKLSCEQNRWVQVCDHGRGQTSAQGEQRCRSADSSQARDRTS